MFLFLLLLNSYRTSKPFRLRLSRGDISFRLKFGNKIIISYEHHPTHLSNYLFWGNAIFDTVVIPNAKFLKSLFTSHNVPL